MQCSGPLGLSGAETTPVTILLLPPFSQPFSVLDGGRLRVTLCYQTSFGPKLGPDFRGVIRLYIFSAAIENILFIFLYSACVRITLFPSPKH